MRGTPKYRNLFAEMSRHGVTNVAISNVIDCTPSTVSLKLNGKSPLLTDEAWAIKKRIFPQYSFEYLFDPEVRTDNTA